MPHPESLSHNVCYGSIPRFDCSYWVQIDRGDFPCTDIVGEFSIIDPVFQVSTYGHHLESDRGFVKNYAVRRCFAEFENYLPSNYDGIPRSFAILHQTFPLTREGSSTFFCRCYFEGVDVRSVDFELSLTVSEIKQTAKKENDK